MNIFVYDPSPEVSAFWLDDVRKNKMILESCQLLSTAMNILHPGHGFPVYKNNHVNHPCSVWVRASEANFVWLFIYLQHLHIQRGKSHASAELFPLFSRWLQRHAYKFPSKARIPFVNCARNTSLGLDFTGISNTHAAYRLYHKRRWETEKPTWNFGQKPYWA